ncbi:hypothetical protein C8F01DRAFT_1079758 [Mycena amicta]|nr:hypothetical protein C8F01DRAFT_1079758 [Mycena amicta]
MSYSGILDLKIGWPMDINLDVPQTLCFLRSNEFLALQRRQIEHIGSPTAVSTGMATQPPARPVPCELVIQRSPFWKSAQTAKELDARDKQHNANMQRYWYLAPGYRIFTRKVDVKASKTPYYDRFQTKAEAIAAGHNWCRRRCTPEQRCGVAPISTPARAVPLRPISSKHNAQQPGPSRSNGPSSASIASTPSSPSSLSVSSGPISIPSSPAASIPASSSLSSSSTLSLLSLTSSARADIEHPDPYDDETPETLEQNMREMLASTRRLFAPERAESGLMDARVYNAKLDKRRRLGCELTTEEAKKVAHDERAKRAQEIESGVPL